MYKAEGDTYVCDICGHEHWWGGGGPGQGDYGWNIWECEKCGGHFCTGCWIKKLGVDAFYDMINESDDVLCPDCYKSGLPKSAVDVIPPVIHRYNVVIEERLNRVVPVEAASWEEAKSKVEQAWRNGEYVLTSDDIAGVAFNIGDRGGEDSG